MTGHAGSGRPSDPAPVGGSAGRIAALLLRNWLETLAALMLLAICAVVFAGMFARYFLHIGLGWTEEAARYLQVWMTFAGATVAVKRWGHFQLTVINHWVPERVQRMTQVFAVLVVAALAVVMVLNGIDITRVGWAQTSPIMGWSIGHLYLVAPISGALMLFYCAVHLRGLLRGRPLPGASHPPAGEPAPSNLVQRAE